MLVRKETIKAYSNTTVKKDIVRIKTIVYADYPKKDTRTVTNRVVGLGCSRGITDGCAAVSW